MFKQTESYPNLIALSDKIQVKTVATVEVGLELLPQTRKPTTHLDFYDYLTLPNKLIF